MTGVVGTTRWRYRWRVFFLSLAAGALAFLLMLFGVTQGAFAVSFTVAGVPYKATGDRLDGGGAALFPGVDRSADGQGHPVLVTGFRQASLNNLCLSFAGSGVPIIGAMTVRITSPDVSANNFVIDVQSVSDDLTLRNAEINRDAGTLDRGPVQGPSGVPGIQSDSLTLEHFRLTAWATTAATLRLNQVHISVHVGFVECF